jgi:hypothetical protein
VPQLITDVFGAESLGNQQRSKEVPQVMETEFFEAGTFFDLRKERIEKIGVKQFSTLVWKEQSRPTRISLFPSCTH